MRQTREFQLSGTVGEKRSISEIGVTINVTWTRGKRWSATVEILSAEESERAILGAAPKLYKQVKQPRIAD